MKNTSAENSQAGVREPHETVQQWARIAGRLTIGVLIGCLLVPSLLELASLIGGISPFKYQGF